jgi:DNA repair photolyase
MNFVLDVFLFPAYPSRMQQQTSNMPFKGRGAVSNASSRFERYSREALGDGDAIGEDDLPEAPPTVVVEELSRSIISRNSSPDISFDQSINPYKGCEHGCVYCYARPTHAYLGLSPGLDFETRLFAKHNAARTLERELRKPGYRPRTIMLGANTDPYQPVERQRRITREILEVLAAFDHPVAITTKSALIARDIDILAPMAERGLASVGMSVTTLDPRLARTLEPRAAAPWRRVETIRALSGAGVPVMVMVAPVIPFLNDPELETVLAAAAGAGASRANYILLRLPMEVKELFSQWLRTHVPDRAERVLNQVRDARNGHLYVSEFGRRMTGTGAYAELLAQRFRLACRRLGLNTDRPNETALDTRRFRPPPADGEQLSLL